MTLQDGVHLAEGVFVVFLITVSIFLYRFLANDEKKKLEAHRARKKAMGRLD